MSIGNIPEAREVVVGILLFWFPDADVGLRVKISQIKKLYANTTKIAIKLFADKIGELIKWER